MRRVLLLLVALGALLAGTVVAVAAVTSVALRSGDNARIRCGGAHLWRTVNSATDWTVKCRGTATPTPTTTTPVPATSSATTTAPPPSGCTAQLGDVCGPYDYPAIPMANGYNTYVSNQPVNVQSGTTETVTATDPGNWQVNADAVSCGGCVQTFPDVQQLTNDWCGSGWGGCSNPTDTPLGSLASLKVNYAETGPRTGSDVWEFAPDVWTDQYGSDIMFWADTQGRCNTGAYGSTVLGHATFGGQAWTVHRYGGAGAEIIFTLDDGAGGCAQQSAGTIDVKAGLEWLVANGYMPEPTIAQLNTGWEICQSNGGTFRVSAYSITAAV